MDDTSKAAVLGAIVGGAVVALLMLALRQKGEDAWNNRKIKKNMLELIGHTQMLRLDSLSKATQNEIFVDFINLDQIGEPKPW